MTNEKLKLFCEGNIREKGDEIPVADNVTYMPSDNPYIYLNGYANPKNKTQFIAGRNGVKYAFKLNSWSKPENGYISLFGATKRGENVEAKILAKTLLSVCLGTSVNIVSLIVNGRELTRVTNARKEPINFKLQVSTFGNKGRLKKIQQQSKNELINLYESMDDSQKKIVDDLIYRFYKAEVKIANDAKKRYKAGEITGYTDWSGFYSGEGVERLNKALNGFSRSLLFPVGNAKVSNDTLMINMTSAAECPSNDCGTCLVRGICYAAANAKFRFGIRHRDRMLHIANTIWRLSNRWDCLENLVSEYIISAREYGYNIQSIRLNEAGDFIDQETLDNYADVMGHLEDEFNIDVTAYTARTKDLDKPIDFSKARELNKAGNPKIILTVSRAEEDSVIPVNFNPNTEEVEIVNSLQAADRFFLALPEDEFNLLQDTLVIHSGQPNLLRNDKYKTNINPQGYYHKCQCDLEHAKTCGDCHVCYAPNRLKDKNGNFIKYFVFCKMHGTELSNVTDAFKKKLDKERNFTGDFVNRGTPVVPDEWTAERDVQMRKNADMLPNWQDTFTDDANARRNPEFEKSLKNVKNDKVMKPQKTYKVGLEEIKEMVQETIKIVKQK